MYGEFTSWIMIKDKYLEVQLRLGCELDYQTEGCRKGQDIIVRGQK